jgi:hypothetical protein
MHRAFAAEELRSHIQSMFITNKSMQYAPSFCCRRTEESYPIHVYYEWKHAIWSELLLPKNWGVISNPCLLRTKACNMQRAFAAEELRSHIQSMFITNESMQYAASFCCRRTEESYPIHVYYERKHAICSEILLPKNWGVIYNGLWRIQHFLARTLDIHFTIRGELINFLLYVYMHFWMREIIFG